MDMIRTELASVSDFKGVFFGPTLIERQFSADYCGLQEKTIRILIKDFQSKILLRNALAKKGFKIQFYKRSLLGKIIRTERILVLKRNEFNLQLFDAFPILSNQICDIRQAVDKSIGGDKFSERILLTEMELIYRLLRIYCSFILNKDPITPLIEVLSLLGLAASKLDNQILFDLLCDERSRQLVLLILEACNSQLEVEKISEIINYFKSHGIKVDSAVLEKLKFEFHSGRTMDLINKIRVHSKALNCKKIEVLKLIFTRTCFDFEDNMSLNEN